MISPFVKSEYLRCSSVITMTKSPKCMTLARRRAATKLVMLYRIANNVVDVTLSSPTRNRGNIEAYKYSFFPMNAHNSYQTITRII